MSSGTPVPEVSEDAQLVAAVRNGDRDAFGRLYERHARMIHGVLLAHVPYSDVDDLVQDVFLAAFRKLSSLREPEAFSGWLLAIARNRVTDFHRRSRASDHLPEDVPDSRDKRDRAAHAALEAIRSLPEAYREPLILRLIEGMTGQEIADRIGLTPGSVRVTLHRGMKQLREKLGGSSAHE